MHTPMMDAFKLLTRSTNLQRRKSQPCCSQISFTDAGDSPESLADIGNDSFHIQPRRHKRKTRNGEDYWKPKHAIDFFSGDPTPPDAANNTTERGEDCGNHTVSTQEDAEALKRARMRMLRSKKIKVDILRTYEKEPSGSKKGMSAEIEGSKPPLKRENIPIYPALLQTFDDLRRRYKISRKIIENLQKQGYESLTEIQSVSLPLLLNPGSVTGSLDDNMVSDSSSVDLLTIAPTGSGKTLAFMIPILSDILTKCQNSLPDGSRPAFRAIILAPTHELVHQIVNEGRRIAQGTGVRIDPLQKGLKFSQASNESKQNPCATIVRSDIVVSTPAILLGAMKANNSSSSQLPNVEHIVIDEADVLLDSQSRDNTVEIWQACVSSKLKSSLWSATLGSSIETAALTFLSNRSSASSDKEVQRRNIVRIVTGLKDSAASSVRHVLKFAANEQGKLLATRQLLHPTNAAASTETVIRPPFLIFTQTISRAIALHSELLYDIPAEAGGSARLAVLHSDLSLHARNEIMTKFRKGEIWVLVTTDILSRGIHFRGINGVVNYDLPTSSAGYVHRAGRTGRAGREGGVCITLYTKEDIPYVKTVANAIAATEKAMDRENDYMGSTAPQWLLNLFPDVEKEARKRLKKKGVAARGNESGGNLADRSSTRISTKSGFERRRVHKQEIAYHK